MRCHYPCNFAGNFRPGVCLMSQSQKTSVSLILRVANQGDIESWGEFAAIYEPLVYRIAITKGLQAADADDLVQEVMTRVARSVGKWEPGSKKGTFRGWISTIARNLIIDFLRKSKRVPRTSEKTEIRRIVESTPDRSSEEQYFDHEYERQIFINAAKEIRNSFTDCTWTAFWRTAVKNEPIKSVAEKLGVSAGAVYVARSRVMARLKDQVKTIESAEVRDV